MYILIVITGLAVAILTAISLSRNFPVPENLKQYVVTFVAVIGIISLSGILTIMGGCSASPYDTTVIRQKPDRSLSSMGEVLYDNKGNNFLNFKGNSFTIIDSSLMETPVK